jgi:putative exosortase-associated protein (TIGR04073 family)
MALSISLGASGCIFDPFGRRLQQAQEAAGALTQRITTLEQASSAGGAVPVTSTLLTSTMSPGGLPLAAGNLAAAGPLLQAAVGAETPTSQWPGLPIDLRRAVGKLLRGLVNVITGWVEIPKRVIETTETSGAGTGFTWGLLRGVGLGLVRTAAGAYDTVTFLVPAPPGYRPVMEPVYVFVCDRAAEASSAGEEEWDAAVRCPVGGETLPAASRYCPEHGVELNAP